MILYHGTSAKALRAIMAGGIVPRGRKAGNWAVCPSSGKLVYLSRCYAPYFAMNASGDDNYFGIVEVDTDLLDTRKLRPDEDSLSQIMSGAGGLIDKTKAIRDVIDRYADLWPQSLSLLGNCAYSGVVPVAAIKRAALIDYSGNSRMWLSFDPTISILNHRMCGDWYSLVTRWIFGAEITPERFAMGSVPFPGMTPGPEIVKVAREVVNNRVGIQIYESPFTEARAAHTT